MKAFAGLFRELYGLFVEDAGFAIAILVWVALFAAILRYLDGSARPAVLFAGFAAILIVEIRRASRH
jgi:hypothetical protein